MAKVSGIPMTLTVQDHLASAKDIANDVLSMTFNTPRGVQDVTGIDKSAMERLLLLADGTITLNGVFNSAVGKSHDVFKTVVNNSAAREVVLSVDGETLTFTVVFDGYDVSRGTDGSITWTVNGLLSNGTAPVWS